MGCCIIIIYCMRGRRGNEFCFKTKERVDLLLENPREGRKRREGKKKRDGVVVFMIFLLY